MDYCVICGSIVPEGTHVCLNCMYAVLGAEGEPGVVMEEKCRYNKRDVDGKILSGAEPYRDEK